MVAVAYRLTREEISKAVEAVMLTDPEEDVTPMPSELFKAGGLEWFPPLRVIARIQREARGNGHDLTEAQVAFLMGAGLGLMAGQIAISKRQGEQR